MLTAIVSILDFYRLQTLTDKAFGAVNRVGDLMSKLYGFRLGTDDEDLEKILSPMTGKERSLYIKAAIRFYNNNGDKINNILNKIEKILSILESGKFNGITSSPGKSSENQSEISNENILIDSIQDLLNF